MPSDKARLYIALYARAAEPKMPGKEDEYHWSFLIGSKDDKQPKGVRIHAKNEPGKPTWMFEARETSMTPTNMILVRIMIGKVSNTDGLIKILRDVPVDNTKPEFNCVTWVKIGLESLASSENVMGTCNLDWKAVRDVCMAYCQRKRDQRRFDGNNTEVDKSKVPTYDLLERKETIP